MAHKINLNFTDQVSYLNGFHRSGWNYVLGHLYDLQHDDGIWCDTYVDRTFHWLKSNLVPYTRPWIGFIHHTFDTTYSDYNNVKLLENVKFIQSLDYCKGLFVFSTEQQNKWIAQLDGRGFKIPVVSLTHPTEPCKQKFTMESFLNNPNKKLVQIGAWLRDIYAIFRLNCGKGPLEIADTNGSYLQKAALIGPMMSNYYKPIDFFRFLKRTEWKLDSTISSSSSSSSSSSEPLNLTEIPKSIKSPNGEIPISILQRGDDTSDDGMCRDRICRDSIYGLNKYVIGAIQTLEQFDASVTCYPQLNNADYDTLLSNNIVFLKLVDCAAVNTVIECIDRNTPIVVNRLPAIVDLLGSDYPLFFDELAEVPDLLTLENIESSYNYLKSMDKRIISIDNFMEGFSNSEIYTNL